MIFDDRVWYRVYECPECGYKSHVTDVHRQCPETPADQPATRTVYCKVHKKCHFLDEDPRKQPTMHRSVRMVPTEWASRFNPKLRRQERRKIKNLPKDAIIR